MGALRKRRWIRLCAGAGEMIDWSGLWDFLVFRSFVSPVALLIFYYLGAVVVPFVSWLLAAWVWRRYALVDHTAHTIRGLIEALTRPRDRWLVVAQTVLAFLFLELLWRMMFEFLMAYLQIRDALVRIPTRGSPP